jgi:hypothetical protein
LSSRSRQQILDDIERRKQKKLDVLLFLRKKQENHCYWCGRIMVKKRGKEPLEPLTETIDHIIPRSKGGPNHMRNFCLSCYDCNCKKSDAEDWIPWVPGQPIYENGIPMKFVGWQRRRDFSRGPKDDHRIVLYPLDGKTPQGE